MTEHADTIRRELLGEPPGTFESGAEALLALDALQKQIEDEQWLAAQERRLREHAEAELQQLQERNELLEQAQSDAVAWREAEAEKVARLEAERQQAQKWAEAQQAVINDQNEQLRQAIDALIDLEEWAYEEGHEKLAENIRGTLVKLREKP